MGVVGYAPGGDECELVKNVLLSEMNRVKEDKKRGVYRFCRVI